MTEQPLCFLADESCDFAVVRALRIAGYDVFAVGEVTRRSIDSELLTQAAVEDRILITEDKDFGWLVFVSRMDSAGVILLRFPGSARETLSSTVTQTVQQHGDALKGAFTVIQPGMVRISRKPGLLASEEET
jgi:predicted nuclease of predicted toxin-antitoxin system